jgi:Putative prokaryotic signal transducing protein
MKADPEDFRRLYSSLNDDALLAIDRDELVPVAQECLDAEVAARGLAAPAAEEEDATAPNHLGENLTVIASFDNPSEASVARSLLRMAEIPCMLSTDLPLTSGVLNVASEVQLYVPPEHAEQAIEILESEISDEELAAQAEAAALLEEEEAEEVEAEEEEAEIRAESQE